MAVTARRAVAVLWPLALLALFLGAFRRSADLARGDEPSAACGHETIQHGIGVLERCLALDPDDVELIADLGAAYESAGHRDRAEQLYRRALAIDPRDGDVHVRLGRLLLARGDRAGAAQEGEAAQRWEPGASAPRELLARVAGESR